MIRRNHGLRPNYPTCKVQLDISKAKPQMDRMLDDYKEPQASDVCPEKGPLKAFAFESNGPRTIFAIRYRL